MVALLLIIFGLAWGSFANALAWRLHERRRLLPDRGRKLTKKQRVELKRLSILHGRSECPQCQHVLAAKDLVPVLSWLLLRGRCRYCHAPIPDTPLPELAMPVLFAVSYWVWPLSLRGFGLFAFVLWLVFLVGFVALAIYDFRWLTLPNEIVFPLIGLSIVQVVVEKVAYGASWRTLVDAALGVFMVAGVFYILFLLSNGTWIGGGDVKLGIVLGALAGSASRGCLVLLFASLSGLAAAIPLMIRDKTGRKTMIPFGPFLMLGLIIVTLFGTDIMQWYNRLIYA